MWTHLRHDQHVHKDKRAIALTEMSDLSASFFVVFDASQPASIVNVTLLKPTADLIRRT